jgi:8-oxo-dGTP pyrophosphatase MutT (NUDIX family)
MKSKDLVWREEGRKTLYEGPVFSVDERICRSPDNEKRSYTVLNAADWAIVVPVLTEGEKRQFVMVRQWRHGALELSLEFPGGVIEEGESPGAAAERELLEETGYRAGRLVKLGEFSPNPAIMSNRVFFFIAEDLKNGGRQNLDEDEYMTVETAAEEEVIKKMGRPPYIHALMGTALGLYLGRLIQR